MVDQLVSPALRSLTHSFIHPFVHSLRRRFRVITDHLTAVLFVRKRNLKKKQPNGSLFSAFLVAVSLQVCVFSFVYCVVSTQNAWWSKILWGLWVTVEFNYYKIPCLKIFVLRLSPELQCFK